MSKMTTVKCSDFRQICRTCLLQKDDMEPLRKFHVPEMLATFTSIKIELDDGFPVLVCSECLSQIRNCYKFTQQCEHNNRLLHQIRLENTYTSFQSIYYTETNDKNDFIKDESSKILNEQVCKDVIKHPSRNLVENDCTDVNLYTEVLLEQDNRSEEDCDSSPDEPFKENTTSQSENITDRSKQNRLVCKICTRVLKTAHSFARHMQMHNKEKDSEFRYKCSICQGHFKKRQVVEHMSCHETEELKCETCNKIFIGLHACAEHMKTDHNADSISCKKCGKLFILKRQLEIHMMKAHLRKLRYECKICGKRFPWQSKLNIHKVIHFPDRSFSCELCDSSFKLANTLKIHMRGVHQGKKHEKKLCKICGASVIQLQQHIWAKHSKEKPFNCDECEGSFVSKSLLNKHVRQKHKGEEMSRALCNTCGKTWRSKADLEIHMRTHSKERPYDCNSCGKNFVTKSSLKTHIRTHTGERPYPCNTCGKNFGSSTVLKKHIRIHTGEKPYACSVCEKPFRQASTLRTHMKIH